MFCNLPFSSTADFGEQILNGASNSPTSHSYEAAGSVKTRNCMEIKKSFILLSTVVFTKASCSDHTPFAAVSSIKEKGQMKISVVAK